MVKYVPLIATIIAVLLALAAMVTLSMERHFISGTFFTLTAFAIYIREKSK